KALRGVVHDVLMEIAKNGLIGEHHFYITFYTQEEGVRLSERMRAQYPDQMTIILQHQYWDLSVNERGFEVGLSFGGIPEKLFVPFDTIKGFFDPSVQFGLQFEKILDEADHETETRPQEETISKTNAAATTTDLAAPTATLSGSAISQTNEDK